VARAQAVVPSLLGVADIEGQQWHHAGEAVRAVDGSTADPFVLVGHSGGGLLLPTIADTLTAEVAALVFVDSFLPPPSGSLRLAPPQFADQLRTLATDGVLPPWSSWFGEDAMRELVGESATAARRRGWPVAEISGVQHLAIATEPPAVTDALLELEGALVGSA
jgi:pimeloyl-ACP methyl ester carboxylesterase